jgi:hypothetical protein
LGWVGHQLAAPHYSTLFNLAGIIPDLGGKVKKKSKSQNGKSKTTMQKSKTGGKGPG